VKGNPYAKLSKPEHIQKSPNYETSSSLFLSSFLKAKVSPIQVKQKTITNLIKSLQLVFADLIKLARKNEGMINPLHVLIYDHFMQKFGLKNVAEKNYEAFVLNIFQLRNENDYFRLFSKLLFTDEVLQTNNMTGEDLLQNPKILHSDGLKVQFALNVLITLDESGQRNTPNFDRMYTTLFKI
jgi:hypothetical protein